MVQPSEAPPGATPPGGSEPPSAEPPSGAPAGSTPPSADLGQRLLELAGELVNIPSVSGSEADIASFAESILCSRNNLEVVRLGDNVLARTKGARTARILLAGHLDTVPPPSGPAATGSGARIEGGVLEGLGAVDMKGGVAVLLELTKEAAAAEVEVTVLLYACEEVGRARSGLLALARERPDLLACDAAVLAEPTAGVVEAGCQGTLRLQVTLAGKRAHTARPWMGTNALHRLAGVLGVLDTYAARTASLDGCEFVESLQAVGARSGIAGNVVPDLVELDINYRFAPDRTAEDAIAHVRETLESGGFGGDPGDRLVVVDVAEGALPSFGSPLLASLATATGRPPKAKVGWTDVAFFAGRGTPAVNFGPGDPSLCHSPGEHVSAGELADVYTVLQGVIGVNRGTPPLRHG